MSNHSALSITMTSKKEVNFRAGRTTDLLCGKADLLFPRKKWRMGKLRSSGQGWSFAKLAPGGHAQHMFLRALQPLLPGGSKENSRCGWFWGVCTLVSSTSFPALSLSPFYACYLTQDRIAPAWVLTQPGPHSNPFFFLNLNLFILIGG